MTLLGISACGSNTSWPATPTEPIVFPVFGGGTFGITFLGDSSACGDIKNPQAGTAVAVLMTGSAVSSEWTGRAATPDGGQFEFRLLPSDTPPPASAGPLAISIVGSATGTAIDSFVFPGYTPRGTSLIFGDRVELTGTLQTASFAQGRVNGPVTFTRNGVSSTCPGGAVGWTLNALPAGAGF